MTSYYIALQPASRFRREPILPMKLKVLDVHRRLRSECSKAVCLWLRCKGNEIMNSFARIISNFAPVAVIK